MIGFWVPSFVLAVILFAIGYVAAGWWGLLVGVAATTLLMSRTMGWISLLMMHMGPGDEDYENNDTYEPRIWRLVLLGGVVASSIIVVVGNPGRWTATALGLWGLGIASTLGMVVRPYQRGCAVQVVGLVMGLVAALVGLWTRGAELPAPARWGLWVASGVGTGLALRRPVGDDSLPPYSES